MTATCDFLRNLKTCIYRQIELLYSVVLRNRNSNPPFFKLSGVAMCLNLESLVREILQLKISFFVAIVGIEIQIDKQTEKYYACK